MLFLPPRSASACYHEGSESLQQGRPGAKYVQVTRGLAGKKIRMGPCPFGPKHRHHGGLPGSRVLACGLAGFRGRGGEAHVAQADLCVAGTADRLVAEATDGAEAVTLAKQLRPDVCHQDVRRPEGRGHADPRSP